MHPFAASLLRQWWHIQGRGMVVSPLVVQSMQAVPQFAPSPICGGVDCWHWFEQVLPHSSSSLARVVISIKSQGTPSISSLGDTSARFNGSNLRIVRCCCCGCAVFKVGATLLTTRIATFGVWITGSCPTPRARDPGLHRPPSHSLSVKSSWQPVCQ